MEGPRRGWAVHKVLGLEQAGSDRYPHLSVQHSPAPHSPGNGERRIGGAPRLGDPARSVVACQSSTAASRPPASTPTLSTPPGARLYTNMRLTDGLPETWRLPALSTSAAVTVYVPAVFGSCADQVHHFPAVAMHVAVTTVGLPVIPGVMVTMTC